MRALQRLALALLVDTQDKRILGRAQIQAHDIAQLLDEERTGGQLEVLAAMRLQAKQLEVAMHAGGRYRGLRGDRARFARSELVMQAADPTFQEALTPLADGGPRHVQAIGNHAVGFPGGRAQYDASTRHQRRRNRARARHRLRHCDPPISARPRRASSLSSR